MSLSCRGGGGVLEQPGVRLQGLGLRCGWLSGHSAPSACPPHPHPAACRCSPLGSASPQCHENSTCVCRPGFVGYKCDRCQDNFFLTADRARCQECPSCYTLVKAEVSPPTSSSGPGTGNCPLVHSFRISGATGCLLPVPTQPPGPCQPGPAPTSALPLLLSGQQLLTHFLADYPGLSLSQGQRE